MRTVAITATVVASCNTAGLTSPTPRIKKVFLYEAPNESPAQYQEIYGDIYDAYVGTGDSAID
jgi:hypothetical protein